MSLIAFVKTRNTRSLSVVGLRRTGMGGHQGILIKKAWKSFESDLWVHRSRRPQASRGTVSGLCL
jgi:hypothetical protein